MAGGRQKDQVKQEWGGGFDPHCPRLGMADRQPGDRRPWLLGPSDAAERQQAPGQVSGRAMLQHVLQPQHARGLIHQRPRHRMARAVHQLGHHPGRAQQ